MVFIIMASLLTMVMLVSIIILVIIRSRNYKKENYVVEVWTMGEEEDQVCYYVLCINTIIDYIASIVLYYFNGIVYITVCTHTSCELLK